MDRSMDFFGMMEIDPPTNFPTKDDEIKYWMELAHEMYERNETTSRELQEYQQDSQCVEKELESSFWESDQKNRDLSHENFKLITNNELLREKLSEQIAAYSTLQDEMKALKMKNIELVNEIRNLEQRNDDLERDNRALKLIEEDMESRYNDAIEKIALLETDLLEENYATFDMERLEKENEDLKQQIEKLKEDSRSDFIRTRKEINQVRSPIQHRQSHNLTSVPFDLITEKEREHKANLNVTVPDDNLTISSPIKSKVPVMPQVHAPLSARKQKYNTEGRDLSQAFAHYKQQENKERNSLNGNIEVRAKKVKEEEKRQRLLSSFVKRLRSARNQLLRRNE